jgi:alkanesulfonate monooxygenase SsuD/methylene tetrahydromethanopterin reductase-like flavin-dependent oxidoreductase (luciferase family)
MKIGVSLFAQNYTDWDRFEAMEADPAYSAPIKIPDSQVYREQFHLGRLVEPLGYDSLWTVEHHFTPYTMVNNPFQFLSYFAGCTEQIEMGTMVVVAPWHDPIRVAEGIIALDYMLDGRKAKIGFGRGLGDREFDGLRTSMDESRERFLETIDIVRLGLSQEWWEYSGKHYQIPRLSLRPQPRVDGLADNLYCSWGSPSTLPIAANAGLKPMFIPSKSWDQYRGELEQFNQIRQQNGWGPERATAVCWVYCAPTEEEARAGAVQYMSEYGDSALRHYKLTGDHFGKLKDYEYYAKMSEAYRTANAPGTAPPDDDVYVQNHVWGTPEMCIEKLRKINEHMGVEELIAVMQFGAMPIEKAEASMRLFAQEVLPVAQGIDLAPIPA